MIHVPLWCSKMRLAFGFLKGKEPAWHHTEQCLNPFHKVQTWAYQKLGLIFHLLTATGGSLLLPNRFVSMGPNASCGMSMYIGHHTSIIAVREIIKNTGQDDDG